MTFPNDRDCFKWLHFGNWLGLLPMSKSTERAHWKALIGDLALLHDASGPWDALFITGDIARTAADEEYELVTTQIAELLDKLSQYGSAPVVLTVPGTLDVPPDSRVNAESLDRASDADKLLFPSGHMGSGNLGWASGFDSLASILSQEHSDEARRAR